MTAIAYHATRLLCSGLTVACKAAGAAWIGLFICGVYADALHDAVSRKAGRQ